MKRKLLYVATGVAAATALGVVHIFRRGPKESFKSLSRFRLNSEDLEKLLLEKTNFKNDANYPVQVEVQVHNGEELINFLPGEEEESLEFMKAFTDVVMTGSSSFFRNTSMTLIINATKLAKRAYGDSASLRDIDSILNDKKFVEKSFLLIGELSSDDELLFNYFIKDYYSNINSKNGTKTWEQTSTIRSKVSMFLDKAL